VGASGNGYSKMAGTSHCVSEFIRALGWRAAPAGNDLALSVPLAIDAGLGQLGRNGGLVTTKFGPRVRIAKVFVEMPLPVDAPINFGVTEFCDNCEACAEKCPSGAIPTGPRTWEGKTPSNSPGALKWYVHVDKCYDYNDFACQACKASCPFNKPNNSWVHKLTRQFVEGRIGTADKVMVKLDQASGYGKQMPEADFWKQDGSRTFTARGL
jgi:reductive dehalogenase